MFKISVLGIVSAIVPTKTLNNGLEIPVVSLGTFASNNSKVYDEVTMAFKNEVFHIDTAHNYCEDGSAGLCPGPSIQPAIAKAIKDSNVERNQIFISTKVAGCGRYDMGNETCHDDTLRIAQQNLDELQMEYVDVLSVHHPDQTANCTQQQAQWRAMMSILNSGKAKAIGISNYCKASLDCLFEMQDDDFVVPVMNQIQYHVGMGPDPQGIASYSSSKNIQIQAYDPMGMRYHNNTDLVNGTLVTDIGKAHGKAPSSIGLKWIIQNDVILSMQTASEAHLQEDIDIFDWTLTDDEMDTLNSATKPEGVPSYMCSDAKEQTFIE